MLRPSPNPQFLPFLTSSSAMPTACPTGIPVLASLAST